MRKDQTKHIEDACAGMAAALAQLVVAVGAQTVIATSERSSPSVLTFSKRASRPVADDTRGATDRLYDSDDRTKPSRRINVYLAGSRGCALLAENYGSRIMAALGLVKAPYVIKCGTTTGDLAERLRQIGQDGYGAAVRTENGIEMEAGFKAWIAHTISTTREPLDPAVTVMPRVIAVDLPSGLKRRVFDAALHHALKGRSLASVPPSVMPRRFVAYDLVEMRVNAAKEFYALSPHDGEDGDLLLDAIEDILRRFRTLRARNPEDLPSTEGAAAMRRLFLARRRR